MRTLGFLLFAALLQAETPQLNRAGVEPGVLPERWSTEKPRCLEMQEFYIHEYNPNFFMMRQSPCTNDDKPILYLVFGSEKALLWDVGSPQGRSREMVDRLIARWLKVNRRDGIPLVVIHSHSHEGNIRGDAQFADRPNTTFIKPGLTPIKEFFGFKNWPDEAVTYDLGNRVLDLIPVPGHSADGIALYDRRTGVLLTGDTVLPGRLYIPDFAEYKKSIHRMAEWTDGKVIAHVLGNTVEQSRLPFEDYPVGKLIQPNEHEMALSVGHILELDRVLSHMQTPARVPLRDFTIWPLNAASIKEMDATQKKSGAEDEALVNQ